MKKIIAALLIITLLFAGCSEDKKSLGISEEVISDTDILKMKITEVSASEIAVELINESKCFIQYGEPYTIEFLEDGEWNILAPKEEPSFIEIAYVLEKEMTCTWGANMSAIYGNLPEGNYRIIKHFTVHESEMDFGEPITLEARFRIG